VTRTRARAHAVYLLRATLICALVLGLLALFVPWQRDQGIAATDRPGYSLPWPHKSPFYPAEFVTDGNRLVDWRGVPSATYCAECHAKEYREWAASIHAVTGPDVIYDSTILQNELASANGGALASEKIRWCDGCHEPLGVLVGEATPVPAVGPNEAIEEGTSCIVCHAATAADPLAGNAALTLNINVLERYLDPALIMAAPEQHARSMQARRHNPLMGQSRMCGACHTEIRPPAVAGDFPLHLQETYDEWRLSEYASAGIECQDCHMHPDPARYVEALKRGELPAREISHRFVGSNYLLAATDLPNNLVVHLRGGWFPGRNVFMNAEQWLSDLQEQQQLIEDLLAAAADLEVAGALSAPGDLDLEVAITNSGAGHALPTGPLDQRHMWLEVRARDARGTIIHHSGWFDEQTGEVDPAAVIYIKHLFGEAGERINRHVLFDVARMQYTRKPIAAGETDRLAYRIAIPPGAVGPVQIEVRLWYRIALQELLDNVRDQITPPLPIEGLIIPPVLMQEATLEVETQSAAVAARVEIGDAQR